MASVVGIDLGNLSSKVGVARRKGIDIIANEVSNRATPSLVSFTPRQRFIGEAAKTAETSNFKNTVGSLKRLIGRTLSDPEVEEYEKKFINAKLVDVNGSIGVEVNYMGEPQSFSYTQLVAAYLGKLRDTAAAELKQTVSDVVIAVPGWYTDIQRRAVVDAAQIAGLNPLRLINDTTAVALGYGITKELPEDPENPRHVCFVDVGHSNFSVSVVAFSRGQLTVKSTSYDRHFGGRDFDYALLQHFAKEFDAKYKIDVMSSPKAIFRLATGCERLKKILSANAEAPISVESLMNDVDASSSLSREAFEKLTEHLLTRVANPVQDALAKAGLSADQIDAIELVGGATRMPAIKERIAACFPGKTLGFTLNQDEAVARGATLACASLSPVFRVREFAVHDITPYPIKVSWEKEPGNPDEDTELVVFPEANPIPSTKILTFYRQGPFELQAEYDPSAQLPKGTNPWIGKYTIKNVDKPKNAGDFTCVKVKARLNLHGIMNFEGAYMVEEVEKEEVTTVGEGDEKREEKKMVKKLQRKGDCSVIGQYASLTKSAVDTMTESEGKMHAEDKLVMETEDRKNALEEYVYDTRGKLDDRYAIYVQESEKTALLQGLQEAEDWLYTEEGEDATKSAYVSRLDKLKAMGDPIVLRWKENEARPKAAAELREALNLYLSLAQGEDEKYSHISEEDKGKVIEKCATTQQWLDDKLARQAEKPKNVNPVITSAEILKRAEDVRYTGASTMNRPKPKPKVTESQPQSGQQTPKDAPKEEKMDVEGEGDGPEIQEMDVD